MEQLPAKDSSQAVFVAEAIRKYWRTIVVTVLIVTGAARSYGRAATSRTRPP
jgi:hypothetical protein